ncbi:MAG: TolC family protein [Bacteroidales bacterium]|nr:TolC family protein [Bacteroidales bacterium]
MKKILFLMIIISVVMTAENADCQTVYTLQQLLDSAVAGNVKISSSRLDAEAARHRRKEAFTKYFPSVSATGLWFNANKDMAEMEINPSEVIPQELGASLAQSFPPETLAALGNPVTFGMMKDGVIGSVTAVQPVFAGGQIVNGNRLAKIGEEAADLQLKLSENEIITTTDQYFWQLVSLQEKEKTLDAVDSLLSGIYKDVDVAVRAGVAMRNDLLQVQLRRNDIDCQRIKLKNGISLLKLILAQYCNLSDTTFSVTYADIAESELVMKDQTAALNSSAEYQLLEKQVEAAALQKKMELGKNLPSAAVGAGLNYHNLMDKNQTFGMVFATVSVPISDWWGGSHAVKRAEIARQKAQDQLDDNSQMLKIRMQKAWNGVTESQQQLLIARRSIEQSEENLRIVRNNYNAGTTKMSDLLEAQLLYQQALDGYTEAFSQLKISETEYRCATGE